MTLSHPYLLNAVYGLVVKKAINSNNNNNHISWAVYPIASSCCFDRMYAFVILSDLVIRFRRLTTIVDHAFLVRSRMDFCWPVTALKTAVHILL
jgi:hypothetical protein